MRSSRSLSERPWPSHHACGSIQVGATRRTSKVQGPSLQKTARCRPSAPTPSARQSCAKCCHSGDTGSLASGKHLTASVAAPYFHFRAVLQSETAQGIIFHLSPLRATCTAQSFSRSVPMRTTVRGSGGRQKSVSTELGSGTGMWRWYHAAASWPGTPAE